MRTFQIILTEEQHSLISNLVNEQIISIQIALGIHDENDNGLLPEEQLIEEYNMLTGITRSLEQIEPCE